jgi:hypothetical protein
MDLGFVLQFAEGMREDDPVEVLFEGGSRKTVRCGFLILSARRE